MTMSSDRCLVVTGYGPFAGHSVNPSWEAVKELEKIWNKEKHSNTALVTCQLPVSYSHVQQNVPAADWPSSALATVHVGVHGATNQIRLETQAHNEGYIKEDVEKCKPEGFRCLSGICEKESKLETAFNVNDLVQRVNTTLGPKACCPSDDAGRYLCEFVLFKSLKLTKGRSLFVHVPKLDSPFSVGQLATALETILDGIIQQVIKLDQK